MKSMNVDVAALVHALRGERPLTSPVGFAKDVHGTFLTAFVATDRETGQPIWTEDGKRVRLNLKKSLRQG